MNSRVPSMKQMVVQKRHTFAAGLKKPVGGINLVHT